MINVIIVMERANQILMRLLFSRFIAIILLVIPGIAATIGFLKMKDALFEYLSKHGAGSHSQFSFDWLHFGIGLLLFAAGIGFLGGWIFFRDRKRNYIGPRFRSKKASATE